MFDCAKGIPVYQKGLHIESKTFDWEPTVDLSCILLDSGKWLKNSKEHQNRTGVFLIVSKVKVRCPSQRRVSLFQLWFICHLKCSDSAGCGMCRISWLASRTIPRHVYVDSALTLWIIYQRRCHIGSGILERRPMHSCACLEQYTLLHCPNQIPVNSLS